MPAPTRPRNYWQLPTFAVGVAAAAAAYANFPPPPADPAALAGKDVAALREMLTVRPVNAQAVTDLARRVADAADQTPSPAAARFAAGSGFVALAEYRPAGRHGRQLGRRRRTPLDHRPGRPRRPGRGQAARLPPGEGAGRDG